MIPPSRQPEAAFAICMFVPVKTKMAPASAVSVRILRKGLSFLLGLSQMLCIFGSPQISSLTKVLQAATLGLPEMKEFAVVKPSKPVDIYVRVSRVGGRENLISPEEQQRRARELAREKGLKLGRVLTDLDESGGKLDRPGLQEALSRVESGSSGGVIVAWLDRLSRDSEHAHALVRRISEAGGVIYAPDAPSDWTSPEGELQAGIVFAFATYV